MQHLLSASAEREEEAKEAEEQAPADSPADHGASGGGRAIRPGGGDGNAERPHDAGHWSAAGDNPRELQSLSREEKQALVKDFGMLGLLASMNADPNAPTVPWGDVLRGADRDSHLGALFGPDPADSWGIGGLTLGGNGRGGGGIQPRRGDQRSRRSSASLDDRIGHHDPGASETAAAASLASSPGRTRSGPGCACRGRLRRTAGCRRTSSSGLSARTPDATAPATRARSVRTPRSPGRVEVRFVIDRQGQVAMAQDGSSDIPSEAVRSCIVKSFYSLSFPSPDNGTVTVVYPMVLTPAD